MDINTALLRAIESKHSSEVARGQAEKRSLPICCAEYQNPRPARLRSLSISSKIYADSYKTLAIAFNATLRNIRN
jgi:hypothetical protein